MNLSILRIIQNYINTIEGIFDRDPSQLSIEEYDEYHKAVRDCNAQGIYPHASRINEIENYLRFEINAV